MEVLIFIIITAVQISSGKEIAYLLFGVSSIFIFIRSIKIRYKIIFLFLIFTFLVLILIRPNLISYPLVKIELLWLSLGFFSLMSSTNKNLTIKKADRILKTIFYSGLLGATLMFFLSILDIFITGINGEHYAGIRWIGGFDGPNEFAAFYVMIIAIGLGLFISRKINVLILIYSIIIILALVYNSYSRGSLFMLLILSLIFVIFHIFNSKNKFLISTIYIFITLGVFWVIFENQLIKNFMSIRENASSRGYLFDASLSMFIEKPFFGHGLGSFSLLNYISNDSPHNDYFYILTSGGIIGLFILLLIYLYPFILSLVYKNYATILFFFTFYISGLFFNNIVRGRISFLFWIIFAVMITIAIKKERVDKNEEKDTIK